MRIFSTIALTPATVGSTASSESPTLSSDTHMPFCHPPFLVRTAAPTSLVPIISVT